MKNIEYFKDKNNENDKNEVRAISKESQEFFTDEANIETELKNRAKLIKKVIVPDAKDSTAESRKQEVRSVRDKREDFYLAEYDKLKNRQTEIENIYNEIDSRNRVINLQEIEALEKEEREIEKKLKEFDYLITPQTPNLN